MNIVSHFEEIYYKRNSWLIHWCIFILCIALVPFVSVPAQTKFHRTEGSILTVSGTSTFKDWKMSSSHMSSDVEFELDSNGNPVKLNSLSFALTAKTLKSGTSGLDKNAYNALKVDKHPIIGFQSVSSEIIRNSSISTQLRVKGLLTIAGVSENRILETLCIQNSNGTLSCTGETKVIMSDFDVKPPSFMMGAMKTGNEVTISYKMNYKL